MDELQQYYQYLKGAGADVPDSYDSFKSTLQDPSSSQKYYQYLKDNKFDAPDTYESFSNTLGLKKKVGGNDSANGSQTASPIASQSQNGFENQSPIDLAKQSEDLSTKTQVVNNPAMTGGMSMGTSSSSTIPDANAVAQSQKINDYLKSQKIDPDQVNKVFGDMPQQAYDMTLPDGTKPQSKQELFSEWQANPIDTENKINNIKTQFALQNAGTQQSLAQNPNDSHAAQQRGIELGNSFMQLQGSPSQSMDDYYNKIQQQQQLIGANLSGDERDKALARLQATTAPNINTNQPELMDEYNQSPLKNIVDPNEYAGLQTLKLFDPQKYQQAVDILQTQITPQYDLPNAPNSGGGGMLTAPTITTDKSLGGTLSQSTIDQQIAQENTHRQLLSIGRENDITNLTSQQYNLNKQYEQTQDPAQKQQIQSQYQQVQDQINGIKQQALSDDKNFPLTAGLKFDNEVKDITGQAGVGLMTYGTERFVKGFQNTTNTAEDILTGLFGNKQDNTNLAMKRIGETQTYQSQMYLPANLNSENVPYTLQASKSLKDQANKILNGRSLSELSPTEQAQLKDLVASNPSQITTVNNDGKHNNFFSKATAYTMAGFTGDIASFMAQTYGLGALGLGSKAAEATTLFNTTYSDAYNNSVSEGDSPSIANQKGLVNGGIMALAGLVSSKYDAVKNMLGEAKSPIGKEILGMGEDAWNAVVNDNKSIINKIANSAKDVLGENAKMIATYGVGTSIATDLANKAIFNKNISTDDIVNNAIEGAKQMTLGSIALMGAGFLTHIVKSPLTMADKVNMWNLASDPDISRTRISDALQNNQITQKQASDRMSAISRLSELMNNIPDVNNKLKPLTDEQKVRYLYNEFVKSKANESLLTLPESQQSISNSAIENSDLENNKILQGNEKTEVDTKLSKPIEGLDEQGIPTGENVPRPENNKISNEENETKNEVPDATEEAGITNETVGKAGKETEANPPNTQEQQPTVNSNSEDKGNSKVDTTDYKGDHQLTEIKTNASNLDNGGTGFDWQHVAQDHDLSDKSTKESYRALKNIKDNPDADVTIYRSVPKGIDKINGGDWVTLSKNYATEHGMDAEDEGKDAPVISMKVKAKDIGWDGNDLNEFVYNPDNAKENKPTISKEQPTIKEEPPISDTDHAKNIKDAFRKEFKNKGVSDEQIDGATALMDARAKSWASEEKGRTPEQWYRKIADVNSGEFQANDVKYQGGKLKTALLGATAMIHSFNGDDGKVAEAKNNDKVTAPIEDNTTDTTYLPLQDNRKIDLTSGAQITDKNSLSQPYINSQLVSDIVRSSNKYGVDPYTALAVSLQETGLGNEGEGSGGNPFHILLHDNDSSSSVDDAVKLLKDKFNLADRKGKKTEADKIQAWNGYGKVGKHTEGEHKSMYGIDVSKEPIDMNENPVYGKRIIDIRDNIIKKNPELVKLVESEKKNIAYQQENGIKHGALETLKDGRVIIHALDAPDFSTMVHEIAHVFEVDLTPEELKIHKDFGGSEAFARGFERYLRDGKSPTPELKTLFDKFKNWLTNIYQSLKGSPIEKKLSPEIKQVFDRLLTEKSKEEPPIVKDNSIVEDKGNEPIDSGQNPPTETPKNENENEDDNKVGVSHKSLTDLANKLGLKPPERGTYPKLSEISDRGRKLLEAGADPNEVTNPKQDLHERIAIGRAHLEDLVQNADEIAKEQKQGINSDEYKEALQKIEDYSKKVKSLGHDAGLAMYSLQGERDLDTGSFSAVRKAFKKSNGEPSIEETNKILDLTKRVKNLEDENDTINKKLIELTDKEVGKNEPKQEVGKFENKAKNLADKFRKLKTKEFKFTDSNGKEYDLQKMGVSWNDVVELGAKAIEASGKVADGVAAVIDKIKDSDFYKEIVDKEGFEKLLQSRYQDMIDATPEGKELKRLKARVEKLESGNIDKKEKTKLNFTKEQQEEYDNLQKKIKDLNEAFGLNEKPKGISSIYEKNKDIDQIGNLLEMFADKRPNDKTFTPEEAKALWDYGKKTYLEKGVPYKDMISMVGKDLGLSFDQVYEGINTTKTKPISNEMWNKNAELNREKRKVKDFVEKKNTNIIGKALEYPSKIVTGTAVFGHGGIFTGTHAGMTYTDLPRAKYTMKAFVNGYKLAYSKGDAYNERMMQQLKDRPNYVIAQRSGLQNIPGEVSNDEYARLQKFFKKVGGDAGVKGFNAIKILRQDLFDSHFRDLSPAEQQDMGALQAIAELVNNATGATNLNIKIRNKAGDVVVDPGKVLFAAEMEAARWEKLLANPLKAGNTGMRIIGDMVSGKKTVSAKDKVFARVWAKRVGWEVATYAGVLTANYYFQAWLNPKNKVNLDDPSAPGYLRLKVGDNTIDMSSGMLGAIGLVANLGVTAVENQKKLGGDSRLKKEAATLGYYGRGKLNPFYGTIGEMALFKTDFAGNPLPFSKDTPKAGKHTLTWSEYAWEKAPIPIADAAKDIYDNMRDNGMSKPQIEKFWSWATLGHFGTALGEAGITGFHISDSHNFQERSSFTDQDLKDPAIKYITDKWGMELPNVVHSSVPIHDLAAKKIRKLSSYSPEIQSQYDEMHNSIFIKEMSRVENANKVYVNDYGGVYNTYPSKPPKYPIKRVSLDDLTTSQRAGILKNAQRKATNETKEKIFKEPIVEDDKNDENDN